MTVTSTFPTTSALFDTADEKLHDLIMFMLEQRVTSYSVIDNIPTGNSYQSVRLRGRVSPGFREGRSGIFVGIPLRGKRVFDIGCNLGENCRMLREAGADLVDGLEYEKLFVRTGQLVNIYNGLTRIDLRQGDASDPAEYARDYDHVFAFSVFPYIKDRLGDIARITKEIFFMETHQLSDRWVDIYVVQAMRHFRHMGVVCATDWGRELDKKQRRLLLTFSNDPNAIPAYISNRANALKDTSGVIEIDVQKSKWHFLDAFLQFVGPERGLQNVIKKAQTWGDVRDPISNGDQLNIGGIEYWCRFLSGYSDYVAAGNTILPNNPFIKYFARGLESGYGDQALREKPLDVLIARRFADLTRVSASPQGDAGLDPVVLYNCTTDAQFGRSTVCDANGATYHSLALDGYHRIFSATVSGAQTVPAMRFWYSHHPVASAIYHQTDIRELLRNVVP